jgi:hypothetical protein
MSPTNKCLCSPGAGDNLPQKRTKTSAQARGVPPQKQSQGTKDNRLVALQKLESTWRCPIFSGAPDTLQFIQPTTGIIHTIVPTVESQWPHQHSALLAVLDNPLSPPTNDYIGVDEDFNNTPVCPDSGSQPSPHMAAGVL